MIFTSLALMAQAAAGSIPASDQEVYASTKHRLLMWQGCTATFAEKYARTTKEAADAVVDAAIGECGAEYEAVADGLRKADGGTFPLCQRQ